MVFITDFSLKEFKKWKQNWKKKNQFGHNFGTEF